MKAAFRNQIICTSVVYLTYIIVGITRGFPNLIGKNALLSENDVTWIASICVLLNPVGSTIAGILMDSFGRIPTLKISTGLLTIGWLAIALSSTKLVIFGAFLLIGTSIGMSFTSSVYVAEISSEANRCVLLSLFIIFFTSGILISYLVTLYLPLKAACLVFASLSAGICWLFFFLQESPHWLAKNGRKADAIRVLRRLYKMTESEAQKEYDAVLLGVKTTLKSKSFVHDVLRSWKPFAIMIAFQVCLQGSGYSLLIAYSSKIFKNITLPIAENSMTITYSMAMFVSSFFVPFAATYGSRKTLMTVSSLGMTAMLAAMLLCIKWGRCTWIVPVQVYAYVFFCTIGTVTLSECLPSEIYRTEVRGFMCGITQAFATAMQGVLLKIFPCFVTESSIPVLSTFALFSFASLLFGVYVLPETKGKTLQEIQDEYFVKKPRILKADVAADAVGKPKNGAAYLTYTKEREHVCHIISANVSDKNELRNL